MKKTPQRLLTVLRTPLGVVALVACLTLAFLTVFGPAIWGDAAAVSDTELISKGPSPDHLFGTDGSGRDILLRTLVATQLSVVMALTATVVGVVGGVLLGLLPLIVGGRLGRWIVAGINIGVAFPSLLLAIAFSVILGQSGTAATFAIAIAMVPNYGRFTHNLAASVWGRDYVSAARVLGLPTARAVFRHVLPNVRDPLMVNAAISAGGALVAFAGLSFLGLGIQVPQYDWGRMLNEGMTRIFVTPAAALVPGIAIILAGLTFVLLGEVLGKALTSSTHRRLTSRLRRNAPKGEDAGSVPALDDGAVLSVRNLRVAAPGGEDGWQPLVHGVSFDVGRGEIVGVVGESGSGKSVTLMAVAGLLDSPLRVAADDAQFDGQPLTLKTGAHASSLDHHLGRRLAMIFQDPMSSLNPALSVGSQVAEPGILHLGMSRADAKAAAMARLEAVRIPDVARRYRQYPHEYSGGMRQRAMIAMGLMGTPALILADEPTTALDVTVQAAILDQLRRVNEEYSTAIVLVSHDIAVVTSLCTRVLVMYRGRLVEDVTTEDLKAGRARHPYTQALLATVPTMSSPRDQPMASIPEDADFSSSTGSTGIEILRAGEEPDLIAEFSNSASREGTVS